MATNESLWCCSWRISLILWVYSSLLSSAAVIFWVFPFLVSHPHLPHYSNRVPSPTPQHTHMTSPHTPPVCVIRLSTGQKNSISSPAFHLKNNLRSAFDQWSGAFSCLLSSRHGAAFICRVAAGHSWPHKESPSPSSLFLWRPLSTPLVFIVLWH